MKTKEFIKKVKELGLGVYTDDRYLYIEYGYYNHVVATIYMTQRYWLSISYNYDIELDENIKKELYNLCFEYSVTPVDKREEEKRFYLKHRYFKSGNDVQYFTFARIYEYPYLQCKSFKLKSMQQFTLKEIEEIGEKFNTNFEDFELVEVEECLG